MLFVDIGNSRIKWLSSSDLQQGTRARSEKYSPDTLVPLLDQHWGDGDTHGEIVIASVAAEGINQTVKAWLDSHWQAESRFLRTLPGQCDVYNGYESPEDLGVDRWMGLIACRALFRQVVCMVDIGSAVTVDFLDSDGRHRGGVIAPGLHMMKQSLQLGTAMPAMEIPDHNSAEAARGTAAGIQAGTIWSVAGLVEYAFDRARKIFATEQVQLVICGGDAARLRAEIACVHHYEPDLVIKGIAVVQGFPIWPCKVET